MFKTRLLSGIVLVLIAAASIIVGGPVLLAVLLFTAAAGYYEYMRVFSMERTLPALAGYLAVLGYFGWLAGGDCVYTGEALVLIIVVLTLVSMAVGVFSYPKYGTLQMIAPVFGFLYVPVMLSYVYRLRLQPAGLFAAGLIFIGSWGCDTCAYCVGMLIGKHRLAPVLSPKKSIEGAAGGIVGSALLAVAYGAAFGRFFPLQAPLFLYGLLAAALAVVSQNGDLFASAVKRQNHIKDYGRLIPGHGGILDRFDSVIVTAPVLYYLFLLIETVL